MHEAQGRRQLASPEELAAALARGEVVILVDHIERENEGDFVLAAEKARRETMAFMLAHANGGLLFLALDGARCDELELPPMVTHNTEVNQTPFTVSVDAREGTHTGVSVPDRLRTVRVILDPKSRPDDLARPGHLFPIRASAREPIGPGMAAPVLEPLTPGETANIRKRLEWQRRATPEEVKRGY